MCRATAPIKVIEPSRGWKMLDIGELWECRELLGLLVVRDIKVRYKQSILGPAWVVLRPLATMAVYTLVFGVLVKVPSDGYPYAVFVLSALLPWTFFSSAVSASGNSLVGSAALIGKVYFPRIIVPLASTVSALVDLLIATVFLLAILPLFGQGWNIRLALIPVLLLAVLFTALGVGILFSALTVAYRDFGNVASIMLQVWMYLTPVIYPVSLVPPAWRRFVFINPLAAPIDGFRSAFLGRGLDLPALALSLGMSVVIFAAGVVYFEKVERRFADII